MKLPINKTKGFFLHFVYILYGSYGQYIITTIAGHKHDHNNCKTISGLPIAHFYNPIDIAEDKHGNIYVTDGANFKVKKISKDGQVSTFAGCGKRGDKDGVGKDAAFEIPTGILMDHDGNLLMADPYNHKIKKIDTLGLVSTFAGNGLNGKIDSTSLQSSFGSPTDLAIDTEGNLFILDISNKNIRHINKKGIVSTYFSFPNNYSGLSNIAIGPNNCLYVSNADHNTIYKIDAQYKMTLFAGIEAKSVLDELLSTETSMKSPRGLSFDRKGNLYVADSRNNKIRVISTDGFISTYCGTGQNVSEDGIKGVGSFKKPYGVLCGQGEYIYVTDYDGHSIRKITNDGKVSTIAGICHFGDVDGVATVDGFNQLKGIVMDSKSNMFVANGRNIKKITPTGTIEIFAGNGLDKGIDGKGEGASFTEIWDIVIDKSDNLYVSEIWKHRIRKITPEGITSTICGNGEPGYKDGSQNIARFWHPYGMAIDNDGNLFVADNSNKRIRKINQMGEITTFAGSGKGEIKDGMGILASFFHLKGMDIDSLGNLFVVDGNSIRKVSKDGHVTTLAGSIQQGFKDSLGTNALFSDINDICVDFHGNIYVADEGNYKIRMVDPFGKVTTFARSDKYKTFDGPIQSASIGAPKSIYADRKGNIYFTNNDVIRKISKSEP